MIKTAMQMGLRGFFSIGGRYIPNGSNIVSTNVKQRTITDSNGWEYQLSDEEFAEYMRCSCREHPVTDAVEEFIKNGFEQK